MAKIHIEQADYHNPEHREAIVQLLDEYARDPAGGGQGLSPRVKACLVDHLCRIEGAFSVLAFSGEKPVALANCFQGFSTFKCQPLINIHDLMVTRPFRGQGISLAILKKIEDIARQRGCCKLTLEVLEGNLAARSAYRKFGFSPYVLDPLMGHAQFWEKPL